MDDKDNLWVLKDNGLQQYLEENNQPKTSLSETDLKGLKEWAETQTAAATKTTAVVQGGSNYVGSVSFSDSDVEGGLQAGAYLVIATDSSNKTTYSTMVAKTYGYDANNLIEATTANVTAKAESYHIEKNQKDDDAVVQVGDLITYEIKMTVPFVKEGEASPAFTITDTLTGASYYLTGDGAVNTFTLNGTDRSDLKIADTYNGQKTFELNLNTLVSTSNTYAGQEIVITYTAKVEKIDEITNKAVSSHDSTGKTTTNYTGQITILKYGDSNTSKVLSGAEFALYKIVDKEKYYAGIETVNGVNWFNGQWIKATEDKVPVGAGKVTTGADGKATVKGLDVGTYYFRETIAPDGYSINETDAEGTIVKADGETTVTVSGNTSMNDTKLSSLPSTGGIGTTIFTIGGCVIMIAAAGLFFASRKKK